MPILAVSTSGAVATAALVREDRCICARAAGTDKRHAETVFPLIERLLLEADTPLSAVGLFAVDVGPGSFTGVRIGVSAVNAMAAAQGKRVVAVSSLRAVYRANAGISDRVCILLDAGNGNGYAAQYVGGREFVPPEAVVARPYLDALPENMAVVTDFEAGGGTPLIPAAEDVGREAHLLRDTAVAAAMPLYLRPSQAERMWKLRQEAGRDVH